MTIEVERTTLNSRLHAGLSVLFRRVDYMDQANYHSTGYGRITLFDTPLSIAAKGGPKNVVGLNRQFRGK